MTGIHQKPPVVPDDERVRARVQTAALAVAVAFIFVGILGFIPGVTSSYHGTG